MREDLRWLGGVLRDREALIDGGHIYQYYLGPDYRIRPLAVTQRGDVRIYDEQVKNEVSRLRELRSDDINGRVVIIAWYRPPLKLKDATSRLLEGCRRMERATVRVYDCGQMSPGRTFGQEPALRRID